VDAEDAKQEVADYTDRLAAQFDALAKQHKLDCERAVETEVAKAGAENEKGGIAAQLESLREERRKSNEVLVVLYESRWLKLARSRRSRKVGLRQQSS
jgi:hypothetical protein